MITVGIVGVGLIGSRRLAIAHERSDCRVVFAVDPDPVRREAVRGGGCHTIDSIDGVETARLGPVDAIFVAVPHDKTADTVSWALRRGSHVLCEKPLGLDFNQATALAALAAKSEKKLCAGFNYRYLPGVKAVRETIASGKLGSLYRMRMLMGHGGRPGMEKEWKLKKARAGGGVLIDPGIHLLDLVRHLIGEPQVVGCSLRRHFWQSDIEDFCRAELICGAIDVTIEVTLTSWKNQFNLEIYGSDGMVRLDGRGGNYGTQRVEYVNRWFWQSGQDLRSERDHGAADPSFAEETTAFLDWIKRDKTDGIIAGADDGRAALRLVERLYEKAGDC